MATIRTNFKLILMLMFQGYINKCLLSQITLSIVIKNWKHTSDIYHLNVDNKICKPKYLTHVFLVNMTLEKHPRGKLVKINL